MLSRNDLIDLIENRYFAAMDRKDLEGTMSALHPECIFTVFPAGDCFPGRDTAIRPMFEKAFEDYRTLWHGNFNWVVDEEQQIVAAWFDVMLERSDGSTVEMNNGKFFHVRDGKLIRLDLYLSTSEAIVSGQE